jgi:GT2 family glycosyltransferase
VDASIIVVSYNTKELTLACLASIREHTARLTYEVIVVDNASIDGSADAIAQACPWVTLRRTARNLGFSGGVNDGLSVSLGEFIILFNSDAYLVDNAFLAMLEYARAHAQVGAVGCRVMNEDRSHQPTAARFPDLWLDFSDHVLRPLRVLPQRWRRNCVDAEDYREPVDVDWLSGSCALYRRTALETAGGIDEDFFLGEEDIDLGYRLTQAGWRIVYLPFSGVVHLGRRSRTLSPASAQYFFRGRYLFYKKHRSPRYARAFRALLLVAYGVRWLSARARVALGAGSPSRETLTRYEQYWQAIRRCG